MSDAGEIGRRSVTALAVGSALLAAVACGDAGRAATSVERVVAELESQRYGRATAYYQRDREVVLSPEAAPAWRRALEHSDPTVREWAVDAVGRIGLEDDVPRLVAALDDPFRKVQQAAVDALAEGWPERAAEALGERLDAADPEVRMVAAQGLAQLGDASRVPRLTTALRDPELASGERQVVAQALGRIGDPGAVEPLLEVALDEEAGLPLRRTAAEALAMMEGPVVQEATERLMQADDDYIRDVARRIRLGS